MDESIAACPARHPMGQHVLAPSPSANITSTRRPSCFAVLLQGDVADQVDEAVVALLDDRLGDLIVHRGGRRSGPDGVLERESSREARSRNDIERGLKVGFSLSRESRR